METGTYHLDWPSLGVFKWRVERAEGEGRASKEDERSLKVFPSQHVLIVLIQRTKSFRSVSGQEIT